MIIQLDKWDLLRVKEFAHNRSMNTKLYRNRGNFKYCDIIVGALSEIAVHHYLWENGIECTEPDFTIYDDKNKSYDADLVAPYNKYPYEKYFHIKSQSIAQANKPWANSWLLQKNDPIVTSAANNHYLVCTVVDPNSLEVEILGKVALNYIHNNKLFKKPVIKTLQSNKVAIYWDDLKEGNLC